MFVWMQVTPSNLKWQPPVAYKKIPMQEVLADRNLMQETNVQD